MLRLFLCRLTSLLVLVVAAASAVAGELPRIHTSADQVAIKGYDAVAYFTEGRATQGDPAFQTEWEGARWMFANAHHRDLFISDPDRYAPVFPGYCTMSMSMDVVYAANPELWTIVDGRLYMTGGPAGLEKLREAPREPIAKATENYARRTGLR
jgi:hypothetical protein